VGQVFSSERLSLHLGAEVNGLDLSVPLDEHDVRALRSALLEHHVLFFRDQRVDTAVLKAVAGHFGTLDVHAFGRHVDGEPAVGLLDQTQPEKDGANRWHTDSTFMPTPPLGSLLAAVKLPEVGGDTCWASSIAAYERLSPELQNMLSGLSATHDVTGPLLRAVAGGHSIGSMEAVRAQWPEISHPIVCRHPETGRQMLFVNSNFTTRIDGIPDAESAALLRFLFEHIRTPELQVRFKWREGSVALWDNRCTQHYASADYQERRVMHRVTIAGTWSPS
jgi:taurine dioxygenase